MHRKHHANNQTTQQKGTSSKKKDDRECNCHKKNLCPLEGKCRSNNVIYQCTASTTNEPDKVYIGLTEGEWKKRYYNHTQSFRTKRYANSTTLSSYVWDLKAKKMEEPNLKWSILKSAPALLQHLQKLSVVLARKASDYIIQQPREFIE